MRSKQGVTLMIHITGKKKEKKTTETNIKSLVTGISTAPKYPV